MNGLNQPTNGSGKPDGRPVCGFARHRELPAQRGFGIVELFIAMVVGLFGVMGATYLYAATIQGSSETLKQARLNQDLRATMYLITSEIRRAGAWANALSDLGSDANNNPFMAAGTDIAINADSDCILFAYDGDANGAFTTGGADPDERLGFRLDTAQGAVQSRAGASGCAASGWADMTDSGLVQITALGFTEQDTVLDTDGSSGASTLTIRNVTITLTGRLQADPTVTRTLIESIRVRNDRYTP